MTSQMYVPIAEIREVKRLPSMNPPTRENTSSVSKLTRSRRLRAISDSHNRFTLGSAMRK